MKLTKKNDCSKIKKYSDLEIMQKAIKLAKKAGDKGEIPIAAIIARDGEIISQAKNEVRTKNDPTAHAEIIAIKKACKKLNNFRLPDCTIYTTLEPCIMCAGAIIETRFKKIIISAPDEKRGAIISKLNLVESSASNHKMEVEYGLMQNESSQMLSDFFREIRRNKWIWRGIEVVITGLTRNQFACKRTWVRIPPSPPNKRVSACTYSFVY